MQCLLLRTVLKNQIFLTEFRVLTTSWPYVTGSHNQPYSLNMSSKADDEKTDTKVKEGSPGRGSQSGSKPQNENVGTTNSDKKEVSSNKDVSNNVQETSTAGRVTRQSIHKQEEVDQLREKYLSMDLESKRKLYKSKFVTLENIKTWPEYCNQDLKRRSKMAVLETEKQKEVREDLNKKISLFQGDITSLEIDAIVNAANESLLGGGGVDGAIHRAAGPHLRAECATLHGCEAGDAKITCGYNLPAKYIIHTVGPRGENSRVLNQCYTRCLELVKEHKLTSVAFPCISTGIFGYPNVNAAKVALSTIRQWLEKEEYSRNVQRIILCLFLKVDVDAYEELMPRYFPTDCISDNSANKRSSSENKVSPPRERVKRDSKDETDMRKD